jgi:hypothetical protein
LPAPAPWHFQAGLGSAQTGQSAGTFSLDQGLQTLANQGRLFMDPGERLSAAQKFVIKG